MCLRSQLHPTSSWMVVVGLKGSWAHREGQSLREVVKTIFIAPDSLIQFSVQKNLVF